MEAGALMSTADLGKADDALTLQEENDQELIPYDFSRNSQNDQLNLENYMVYARRLNSVIRIARFISYQLACLSTLGGANHLCDKPKVALKIAMRQEFIGHAIGSTSIVIRARVYQAVNYGLLDKANKANKIFIECEEDAILQGWSSLIDFVKASKIWLQNELEYKKLKNI